MARSNGGFRLDWQNVIMTIGLLVVIVGGFWTLAYIPIQGEFEDLKGQVSELRNANNKHATDDEIKFLTQKEHNEYKGNVDSSVKRIEKELRDMRKEAETRRAEAATRQDVQNALNTTRVEFLSEIKRLDQKTENTLKREEFAEWKTGYDRTITSLQDRQNRFSEALDSMYSKVMNQMRSYPIKPE